MTAEAKVIVMRSAAWLFALLGLGLGPADFLESPQQRPTTAEEIAASLLQPAMGMSIATWKTRTPAAAWQRYRGTREEIVEMSEAAAPQRGVNPGGFWCAVATDVIAGIDRVVVFYGLRDTPPPACRVELVHGVVRRTGEAEIATLFQELSHVMTQRLGVSPTTADVKGRDTPQPYGGGTGYPEGVARWEEGVRWHRNDRDVFLFRAARALGFSSRSSFLTRESEDEGEPNDISKEAERRLADGLRERFPDAAAAMPYDFVPQYQAEIRRGLVQALDARAVAAPEDRALLTFAADRLARKLWVEPPAPSQHPELAPLLRRGLRFVGAPHGELSVYNGALVGVVLRAWPETVWGQLAFVTRLHEGWTEGCDDQAFTHVIRHGNLWLQSHLESPWRAAVITTLARAYETKWALNGTFTADARENARVVTAEEAAARVRALRLYEELMRLAPGSKDAAYVRRRIVQIRANMTTSQYAYSCVIP
jgi:hypothetical protein